MTQNSSSPKAANDGLLETAAAAIICGSIIVAISFGIRHGLGLYLKPLSSANEWGVQVFSTSLALQNLIWGATQPFVGMVADKFGAVRVAIAGAILYATGMAIMALSANEAVFTIGAGVLIGVGLSGTTFPVIFGTVSRLVPEHKRSQAMGVVSAVASFGQFMMVPVSLNLIEIINWSNALLVLTGVALLMVPLAFGLKEPKREATTASGSAPEQTIRAAIAEAFSTRDFWLLTFGFFACGFQVVFISVHMPNFLADKGMAPHVAGVVLMLIGIFNIGGTYLAGELGQKWRKPALLCWIYFGRAVAIAAFVLLPVTEWSAYIFGAAMGLFWLSTIPLTNGTIASIWGVKYMSMLGGFVFFSHQIGSYLGSWLGGVFYDAYGNYDIVWGLAVAVSLISVIANWPIRETPMVARA